MLKELTQQSIKHTPEDIIDIAKLPDGKIAFLEKGNASSGLEHILAPQRKNDFLQKGVSEDQIPDLIFTALQKGKVIDNIGSGKNARPVYEVMFKGKKQTLSIGQGSNGYIVTAHPVSIK